VRYPRRQQPPQSRPNQPLSAHFNAPAPSKIHRKRSVWADDADGRPGLREARGIFI